MQLGAQLIDTSAPSSGIYEINHVCGDGVHVFHTSIPAMQARCNTGGWTVIFRRKNNLSDQVKFNRTWNEYKHGFGDLNTEFWYGLRNIHCLTTREQVDLEVYIEYANGSEHTYTYEHFIVDGPKDKFTLHIGQLQQPAPGSDTMAYVNGQPFSTYDEDNDEWSGNCALDQTHGWGGGWWHNSCSYSIPTRPASNIIWNWSDRDQSDHISFFEMKIRLKHCAM